MAEENPGGSSSAASSTAVDNNSLEGPENPTASTGSTPQPGSTKPPKKGGIKALLSRFSIYLLMFVFVLIIAIMVIAVGYFRSQSKPTSQVSSQTLSQNSLNQLANSDVTVGDVKQTLNIQSNAVFAGQVLVRSNLEVAGKLEVGGDLSLTGVTGSGDSMFDTFQINKNLNVAGDTALQGQLTVQKALDVNGTGTFNGALSAPEISVNTLQLNGDLDLTHHISAGGATPSRTNGPALGGGGTSSVSGSDTAGSITINTGSSPSAGCLISVGFTTKFDSTPHVVVSPVDAGAAGLGYYITRTTSGFSVCTITAPPTGQTFGFDYVAID
jgi:cytoskeletal protein CcmA (bactofilin family)